MLILIALIAVFPSQISIKFTSSDIQSFVLHFHRVNIYVNSKIINKIKKIFNFNSLQILYKHKRHFYGIEKYIFLQRVNIDTESGLNFLKTCKILLFVEASFLGEPVNLSGSSPWMEWLVEARMAVPKIYRFFQEGIYKKKFVPVRFGFSGISL